MFVLVINENKKCIGKIINHLNKTFPNEIEITEEQYNEINEFPLQLTFDEDNNLVSWEKTELSYEEPVEIVKEPTFEERLTIAEDTINFLLGL